VHDPITCIYLPAGIPELCAALKAQGKDVFLVSGGFRQIIHPLAQKLGIPLDHVFANTILFDVSEGRDGTWSVSCSSHTCSIVLMLLLRNLAVLEYHLL
jgi:phosphoserine phosphatase